MAESTYEPSVAPQYGTNPYPKGTIRYIENMDKKSAIECNEIWKQRSIEWLKQHPFKYLKKIPGRLMYMYYNDMDNIIAFSESKKKQKITMLHYHTRTSYNDLHLYLLFNILLSLI